MHLLQNFGDERTKVSIPYQTFSKPWENEFIKNYFSSFREIIGGILNSLNRG